MNLFDTTRSCGCAAKLPLDLLESVLPPEVADERVVAGYAEREDAAVVRLGDRTLLLTSDVIPPVSADARVCGAVAAANAVSDVYACGGEPHFCLSLLFAPEEVSAGELRVVSAAMQETCLRANCALVGGHSVRNAELRVGLAVIGSCDEPLLVGGAREGDGLFLSKPLGVGVAVKAVREKRAPGRMRRDVERVMTTLNRSARDEALRAGASACTDVTGFGLAGHALTLARASGAAIEISVGALPLIEGALELARSGAVPGATATNADGVRGVARFADDARPDDWLNLLCDPQTSGGLLVTAPRRPRGFAEIGRVTEGEGLLIVP